MKDIRTLGLALLLASSLYANEQDNLNANMKRLDETTNRLESAFNKGDTAATVSIAKELDSHIKTLFSNSDKVKAMLPAGKQKYAVTAINFSRSIDKATVSMIESLEAKNFGKAQKDFLKAKQGCMNCHALVRDWGNK